MAALMWIQDLPYSASDCLPSWLGWLALGTMSKIGLGKNIRANQLEA